MFDVRLNGHVVVKDLDIFDRVGHSTAHDEIVPFSIRRGKLSVQGEVSTFNGKLTVEFVKVGDARADVAVLLLLLVGFTCALCFHLCFRVTMTTPKCAPCT